MESRDQLAKLRLWYVGAVVVAGCLATLFTVNRARRSANQSPGPEARSSQDPDREAIPSAGQVGHTEHAYGLRNLVEFFGIRAFGVLVLAAFGGNLLWVGINESNWVNPTTVPAAAMVIRSWAVNDEGDSQVYARVRFKTRSDRVVRTTVVPVILDKAIAHGKKIPILYNRAKPHEAGYAGLGGDSVYGQGGLSTGPPALTLAAVAFNFALLLLITSFWQLSGIIRNNLADATAPVQLKMSGIMAYVDHTLDNYGLEWQLLPFSDIEVNSSGLVVDARILGNPLAGRMLIIRLENGQLVWPASRAQPVLASGPLRLPEVGSGRVGSAQDLLAGYSQIVDLLSALPVVIRRPPGAKAEWWGWFGALRPMVKTLVVGHLRRRLDVLGSALLREAFLCTPGSQSRRQFIQAGEECRTFAQTLPKRNLLALLATIAATILTIISPFLILPHIPLSALVVNRFLLFVLAAALIFGTAPLYMFFQSTRYKRGLFKPNIGQPEIEPIARPNADWDVYNLERAAFAAVTTPRPVEWESRSSVRLFIGFTCLIPLMIGLFALPVPTLIILGVTAAAIAAWRLYRWLRRVGTPGSVNLDRTA